MQTRKLGVTIAALVALGVGGRAYALEIPTTTCLEEMTELAGPPTINGTPGDNIITGTIKADRISGNGGNDGVNALNKNDFVATANGHDEVQGFDGKDWICDDGSSYLIGDGIPDNVLLGGNGDDTILASENVTSNDYISGDDGNDFIHDSCGDDAIFGGDGRDTILSHGDTCGREIGIASACSPYDCGGDDYIRSEAAVDYIEDCGGNNDIASGGDGDFVWVGGNGYNYVNGNDGPDYLNLTYTNGYNWVYGEGGADTIHTGPGSDYVDGGASGDQIVDFDWCDGGWNEFYGGEGNDCIIGDGFIDGGDGTDACCGDGEHVNCESDDCSACAPVN
jgi:Ca2+-binding RTX toxin-like protein